MFFSRSARYEYWLYRRYRRRRQLGFGLLVLLLLVLLTARFHHAPKAAHQHQDQHPAAAHARQHRQGPATAHRPASAPPRAKKSTPARLTLAEANASADTGLRWASFYGIELPGSTQAGPRHTHGGLAWGFADTPGGALVAALNIAVRTGAQWGPMIYQPTITRQIAGPAKGALLAADASGYAALRAAAKVKPGQPAGRGYAVEAGYRFTAWAPASAAVGIVTEGPGSNGSTVLAVTAIQLRWVGGDWRVLAPPGGNWARSAAPATSLAGYTTFPTPR